MKNNLPSKFAYLACNPDRNENPALNVETLGVELGCSQVLNITLSTPSVKNNPTLIEVKHLKHLKDNYFYLATSLNLYDASNLVRDHYLFLCAFSSDATYSNLEEFRLYLSKKYGKAVFTPFSLQKNETSNLTAYSELNDFLLGLYSATELPQKLRDDSIKKFTPLLNNSEQERFFNALDYGRRNRKDLDYLVAFIKKKQKVILSNGWA